MHLLLTNDDGISAPGLAALQEAVSSLPGVRLSIVAPVTEQSMCGHRVSTREAIHMQQLGPERWAVQGTPADCVRLALFALNLTPDWVLSGVNAGGNLGQDIVISGTVAAAREAAYHSVPAMAFSHYLKRELPLDWPRISDWTRTLIAQLSGEVLRDGEFWNINFPHLTAKTQALPEIIHCPPARSPMNVSFITPDAGESYCYDATYAERPQDPGSDVAVCFRGAISVSRLHV